MEVSDEEGNSQRVSVAAVDADSLVIDANHPLAGKDLTFEITLVKIG